MNNEMTSELAYKQAELYLVQLQKDLNALGRASKKEKWCWVAPVEDNLRRASRLYFAAKVLEENGL